MDSKSREVIEVKILRPHRIRTEPPIVYIYLIDSIDSPFHGRMAITPIRPKPYWCKSYGPRRNREIEYFEETLEFDSKLFTIVKQSDARRKLAAWIRSKD